VNDAFFGTPYIDIDELRDSPLPHRYVHGGFEGTDTRFSLYLPPAERYQGRLFQFLEGGYGGNENYLRQLHDEEGEHSAFHLVLEELGGFLVESNQGHLGLDMSGIRSDPAIGLWRASAQTARFAKEMAAEMYGAPPHHSYVWGGSGGGYRSAICLENAPDVWDGGVPYVISTEGVVYQSAYAYAVEGLSAEALDSVVDASEPGGSGDPFEGLSYSEREALAALYRVGYPRGGETQMRRMLGWGFGMWGLQRSDPSYFDDFWNATGYAGAEGTALLADRVVETTTVVARVLDRTEVDEHTATDATHGGARQALSMAPTVPGTKLGIVLDHDHPDRLFFARVTFTSGAATGRELSIGGVSGEVLVAFPLGSPELFDGVEPGDTVEVDNRDFVAFCHYWRHTGAWPEQPQLAVDGHSIHPVRPQFTTTAGRTGGYTGRISGKVIFCNATHDTGVFIPTAYPRLVAEHLGEHTDEHFRMWWMQNSTHMPPSQLNGAEWQTRLVDYAGHVQHAVRDLVAWVEDGVAPVHMNYEFTPDNRLVLPESAVDRGGVQPVVTAAVNGAARAEVVVGEAVTLTGSATVPPRGGTIIAAEWDHDGSATWPYRQEVNGPSGTVEVSHTHTFDAPGTYFPSFRVASHRGGADGRGAPVYNLARVRVVVT
jgi:hypothetical protein